MENRIFGNQGNNMLKNEDFSGLAGSHIGSGNGGDLQKKLISSLRVTRIFFLVGIWAAFFVLLFISALATAFGLSKLSFINIVVTVWDILTIYGIILLTFLAVKFLPLR